MEMEVERNRKCCINKLETIHILGIDWICSFSPDTGNPVKYQVNLVGYPVKNLPAGYPANPYEISRAEEGRGGNMHKKCAIIELLYAIGDILNTLWMHCGKLINF